MNSSWVDGYFCGVVVTALVVITQKVMHFYRYGWTAEMLEVALVFLPLVVGILIVRIAAFFDRAHGKEAPIRA